MNEREYLTQLESANAGELTQLLRRPSAEEERVLAAYFGEARLARLRRLALSGPRRGVRRGNVVVLHGIMGGELTVYPQSQSSQGVWLNFLRIAVGAVGWLRMTPERKSQFDVRATGILKKWYAEMLLGLAADQWNVQAFWYDWRLDLADSADSLRQQIDRWFGPTDPVHLVAHSMGGLVSRTYILRHADRWAKGGRLIMLGTPNRGSFAIPQVITGALDTVRKLALVDVTHSRAELLGVLNSFPGSMQMLPSPAAMKDMERMYDAKTWAAYGVGQKLLDGARASHERLAKIVDRDRMAYIAGCNVPTKCGVRDWQRLDDPAGYTDTLDGDGTVPHSLGFLEDRGTRIPTYFVECEHGALPNHEDVIAGTQQLLATGSSSLAKQAPSRRGLADLPARTQARRDRERGEEDVLRDLSRRVRSRARGSAGPEAPLSADEVQAGELIVRGFLAEAGATPDRAPLDTSDRTPPPPKGRGGSKSRPQPKARITVRLVHGGIGESRALAPGADAISVGHYVGVMPQNAERALDEAISWPPAPKGKRQTGDVKDLLITALSGRGAIGGGLGQNFLLPDPRDPKCDIVIAGLGQPGTFREAELAVLARELVWMLGRAGKKHLCTILIGAGAGNLEVPDALRAWFRGIRRALYDADENGDPCLGKLTFIDYSEASFIRLDTALKELVPAFAKDPEPLEIDYVGPDEAKLKTARQRADGAACEAGKSELKKLLARDGRKTGDTEPVRVTIRLAHDTFEFAALTADASMPQRETRIDPHLIDEANDQLPAESDAAAQQDEGNLLGRLLLPGDFREAVVRPGGALVLGLDATTARIHWEMVALGASRKGQEFDGEKFLGTVCGLTRQLRTNFAPLPEPPILSGRPLRVLVVADPAEDSPLPGAQEEGEAVAAIFDEFRREPGREVEVVRLFGPGQATRVAVLDQLINHRFDVLHFAGHCFYDAKDPTRSGWIFTGGRTLSANELSRVDRIPRFVFSNACESGITPDRAGRRSALLAPSFAEAFFARGVANFICTAWPVDDAAALEFARRLYRGVLGLRGPGHAAEALHEAMSAARCEIARLGPGGLQTWGAYQHYGDPNFRFGTPEPAPQKAAAPAPKKRPPKKRPPKKRPRKKK